MNFLTIVAQCAIISQMNEKKRYIRTTEYGETDMLIDEIKLRLRNAIKGSGLSQKEIAARVGVHPSTVSKYVRMEKYPSIDTLAMLCRAIGISSDKILGLDDSLK